MADIDIAKLTEQELVALIDKATERLADVRAENRRNAVEAARASLAAVGMSFKDALAGSRRSRNAGGATSAIKAGQKFVNPDDPKDVWIAGERGRRPAWVTKLEKAGKLASAAKG